MKNLGKATVLILAVTLIISLASAPTPVTAPLLPPSLEIDPHPTVTATVSTQFTIQIWIRDIPEGYTLIALEFTVAWDPTQMELIDHQEFTPPGKNWHELADTDPNEYVLIAEADSPTDATDLEMAWASLTFHCLAEGTSKITIVSEDTVWLYDGQNTFPTQPDPFEITCNQVAPRPVGGVVAPVNKLHVLAPYLALAAAVATATALVIQKKRRD